MNKTEEITFAEIGQRVSWKQVVVSYGTVGVLCVVSFVLGRKTASK